MPAVLLRGVRHVLCCTVREPTLLCCRWAGAYDRRLHDADPIVVGNSWNLLLQSCSGSFRALLISRHTLLDCILGGVAGSRFSETHLLAR